MGGTGEGAVETALSGGQMVPSGGLLPAKMAPAGAQMGSGNLINAGIVKKGGREAEKVGKKSRQGRPGARQQIRCLKVRRRKWWW